MWCSEREYDRLAGLAGFYNRKFVEMHIARRALDRMTNYWGVLQ